MTQNIPRHRQRRRIIVAMAAVLLLCWLGIRYFSGVPLPREEIVATDTTGSGIDRPFGESRGLGVIEETSLSVDARDQSSGGELRTAALKSGGSSRDRENEIKIFGRVLLEGKPPAERVLHVQRNRNGSEIETKSRDYEVSEDGKFRNVFVYLKSGVNRADFAIPSSTLRLSEAQGFLHPFLVGLQVEEKVEIENMKTRHPYRLVSSSGREFVWQSDSLLELVFSERDIFSRLVCKVHPWEWAYFAAVEHPYFAVTDIKGYFKLPSGIAPGLYTLAAHHPKAGELTQQIDAKPGGKYEIVFTFQAPGPTNAVPPPVYETEGTPLPGEGPLPPSLVVQPDKGSNDDRQQQGASVVVGEVRLNGTPPPEKPLTVAKNDPSCGKVVNGTPSTRHYLVDSEDRLADAVVYLEPLFELRSNTPPVESLVIEALQCQFSPYVAAVQTGQKLIIRNKDPLFHNAHFTPQIGTKNRELNKAMMPKAEASASFSDPEQFLRLKCDVHPWEFAYVSVFNHPFFAVTDAEGKFSITNVPPGKFRLHAAHRKAGSVSQEITISAGNMRQITLALTAK